MKPTSPTQKQRERYAAILDKKIVSLDRDISNLENVICEIELDISEKLDHRTIVFLELSRELDEYSSKFSLGWPNFSQQTLEVNNFGSELEVRRVITEESNLERMFKDETRLLQKGFQESLVGLKKLNPGKLRHFERRSIQRQIDEQQSKLDEIKARKYPRSDQLSKVEHLLAKFDALDIESDEIQVKSSQKDLSILRAERNNFESKRIGDLFESSCAEFVESEREKRRDAAFARELERLRDEINKENRRKRQSADRKREKALTEQRQKARVTSLKLQAGKNKKFLANISETNVRKDLQLKIRAVIQLERQCSQAEAACIRKVKQLRTTASRQLVPQHQYEPDLIRELVRKDWHRIPALDNLVARLKEKTQDLALAKTEVNVVEKLVEKIVRAKEEIEEFDKVSHLLSPTRVKGKGKGAPPRIPVENWEDAEELAVRYVKWLGFVGARRTKAGSDEGKDVESSRCIVQVKDMGTGATRPMLQQLFGVASAEKKIPIFFSRSLAKTALEWGELHKIALFKFDLRGTITPINAAAEKLIDAEVNCEFYLRARPAS